LILIINYNYNLITKDQSNYSSIAAKMNIIIDHAKKAKNAIAPTNLFKIIIISAAAIGLLVALMIYSKYQ